MMNKILIVDDEQFVRRTLKYRLEREGYSVTTADSVVGVLTSARQDHPNLILLDIGLPDGSGFDVARTIQREMDVAIIFLTGRGQETDVVVGLEMGAEDYIVKPFRTRELLARIRVALRRIAREPAPPTDEVITVGEVALDPKSREVTVREAKVELPPKEFELLRLLMANAGNVLTTNYLLDAVWGEEFAGALQVLYVHIGWLRERIEPDPRHPRYIQTVRGAGYKFVRGEEV
ncbi:MAG: response regulator transcription factor [Acidobacteriota bacterium]